MKASWSLSIKQEPENNLGFGTFHDISLLLFKFYSWHFVTNKNIYRETFVLELINVFRAEVLPISNATK